MSKSSVVGVDFESYYDSEYSLSKMSVFNYCHDPRFDAYLVAVHGEEGSLYVGHPSKFDWGRLAEKQVVAHNALFDWQVYSRLVELGIIKSPPDMAPWLCTADMAAYLGCKRDLATACKFLLGEEVSKATRTKMQGRTGAELATDPEVLKYGGHDAEMCYKLAIAKLPLWPENERKLSILNRNACLKGIAVDLKRIETGVNLLGAHADQLIAKIPWVATGEKPLSPNALKAYAAACGIPAPTSTAKDDQDFLKWVVDYGDAHPWAKAIGEYRSVNALHKRLGSLLSGSDKATGRFPYSIKYFGASTGRFSGGGDTGGKFNMQNMPRGEMFGVDMRPMFVAAPGHKLIISDYSQIEARYLLWRVGDEDKLQLIRKGISVYQAYGEALGLCEPGCDLEHDNPSVYRYCKASVLGAGYGCGGAKFQSVAKIMAKLELTEEQAFDAIDDYRARNTKVVGLWREHQSALALSARRLDPTHDVELMSGRVLTYNNPRYNRNEIEVTQVLGLNRTRIYGGLLTENEVQASCRDILRDAWLACADAGYLPILNVHDELVFEVPEDNIEAATTEIEQLMVTCSPWAKGLPLAVHTTVSDVYTK